MWEKRYKPKSGTIHVEECSPVLMNFKGQNKAWNVGDFSFLLSKNRKNFQEKPQDATMYS